MSMNEKIIDKYIFNATKYGFKGELQLLNKLIELGIDFKYKYAICNDDTYYMASFYIPQNNTVINISTSLKIKSKDIIKDNYCIKKGFKVIRILESNISSFDVTSVL
jgi:very-short-patch-repair endonuclease